MADVRVLGANKLRLLAAELRQISREDLRKELYAGINRALKPLKQEIQAEVPRKLPSGYAPTLAADLKTRTSTRSGPNAAVRVRITAKGKRELRDVAALNVGRLRHPVFGRRRMTKKGPKERPWVLQRIRPGLVDDPAKRMGDNVLKEVIGAVDRVAEKLERG